MKPMIMTKYTNLYKFKKLKEFVDPFKYQYFFVCLPTVFTRNVLNFDAVIKEHSPVKKRLTITLEKIS